MILKISGLEGQWVFIDKVAECMTQKMVSESFEGWEELSKKAYLNGLSFVDLRPWGNNQGSKTGLFISYAKEYFEDRSYVFCDSETYLLNDEGKTIERLF